MTVLTTRRPDVPAPPVPPAVPRRRRVRGAVVRWSIAVMVIVVLGQVMSPVEAHAREPFATSRQVR